MKKVKQQVGVIIGRFQPFHNGHLKMIEESFKSVNTIYLFIGSANRHSSIKNPFTSYQRKELINTWFKEEYLPRNSGKELIVLFSDDYLYSDWKWKSQIIKKLKEQLDIKDTDITLFGHDKDSSSYYLKLFPEWNFKDVGNFSDINATLVRDILFESDMILKDMIPNCTLNFLTNFKNSKDFVRLKEEYFYYHSENQKFESYPYPETLKFNCSDAVVICYGHVLLIQRKFAPGKGTWALPGGFVNSKETYVDACIRELKEETNLRVPEKVLRGNIKSHKMFDNPSRNIGIPRVSMAYYIDLQLNNDGSFPEIRQDSDAFDAMWVNLSDLSDLDLFDDHRDIIEHFI